MKREIFSLLLNLLLICFTLPLFGSTVLAAPDDAAGAVASGAPRANQDPLVGRWECSNGVTTNAIFIQPNGMIIQQEPTFGNTRSTTWIRLSSEEIAIGDNRVLNVTLDGDSRMSVSDNQVGSRWDCVRQ